MPRDALKNNPRTPAWILAVTLALILPAFFSEDIIHILEGWVRLNFSTANLFTDYVFVTNNATAFFNAGVMFLFSALLVYFSKIPFHGKQIAAMGMMIGFSFFGKNLFNSIPIVLGVYFYTRIFEPGWEENVPTALFGTGIAPLISELAFGFEGNRVLHIVIAYLVGIVIGILLPIIARGVRAVHHGYCLYNIGFALGFIGMLVLSIMRMAGHNIYPENLLNHDQSLYVWILLSGYFLLMIVIGLVVDHKAYLRLPALWLETGIDPSDFIYQYGYGPTLINMGMCGMIGLAYVYILGGTLNGPVIGGIFAIVGFAACGKHCGNIFPILLGVWIANAIHLSDAKSTGSLLAALFGTTLAPIAGKYGFIAGVFVGFIHMAIVTQVGALHGGVVLYNNGFSGGIVAAVVVPILEEIEQYLPLQDKVFAKWRKHPEE